MFYKISTRFYTQECKVGCFSLRSKKKGGLTYLSLPLILILALTVPLGIDDLSNPIFIQLATGHLLILALIVVLMGLLLCYLYST